MKDPRDVEKRSPLALDGPAADEALPQGVALTELEWRRLVFLRWLCRTGRLTEWL